MIPQELFIQDIPVFFPHILSCGLLQGLNHIDMAMTVALNFDGGEVADSAAMCLSSNLAWIPWGLLFTYKVMRNSRHDVWRTVTIILGLAITVALCDQLSASVLKPLFERPRPSHDAAICHLLHYVGDYRGGAYGFVSSHATNAFGASIYTIRFFRRKVFAVSIMAFSALVCYSRVYLGVHYVGDVVCEALLGISLGIAIGKVTTTVLRDSRQPRAYMARLADKAIVIGLSWWRAIV